MSPFNGIKQASRACSIGITEPLRSKVKEIEKKGPPSEHMSIVLKTRTDSTEAFDRLQANPYFVFFKDS